MDRLDIINLALLKVGLPLAAALDDCDWNANFTFDKCVEEVLRSYSWGFAQKFESMGAGGAPAFGFTKTFPLPADFVRAIDVHKFHDLRSPKARFQIKGKQLCSNVSPCYLRYVTKDVEPDDFPPDFTDAVACRIAMEITPLSAQSSTIVPRLAQLYQLALATAQATDARENHERVPYDCNILAARAGGDSRGK